MLQADAIQRLAPHAESMCLIECVVTHDDAHIICTSNSHRSEDNPLRRADGLAAVHAIEYGAQAMALHGRLTSHGSRLGVIVAAREVRMRVNWLHDIGEQLQITATVLMDDSRAAAYRFSVQAGNRLLATGRLTVAFL